MLARLRHIALLWLGPVVVAAVCSWLYMHGGRFVSTDNAYLKADKVSISTEISGKVTEVFISDNLRVKKGELLFRVDDQPYRIALARAQANLVKVTGDIESLKADYLYKQADIDNAQTDLDFYRKEYQRLKRLGDSGSVSVALVDQAQYDYQHAGKELAAARQAVQVVQARLIDPALPTDKHPDYLLAAAELEQARLDLSRVETRAPADGIVANFDIFPGEYVAAGAPLFTLIDTSHIWVEANFKETDLTYLRTGQTAVVEVDTYADRPLQGRVSSITPGTGSEFSLLPAQNSSGNWVKVVQRISVRLDIEERADLPQLTAGMSALVEVDTGHERHFPWVKES